MINENDISTESFQGIYKKTISRRRIRKILQQVVHVSSCHDSPVVTSKLINHSGVSCVVS